jgi:hypothetical protein
MQGLNPEQVAELRKRLNPEAIQKAMGGLGDLVMGVEEIQSALNYMNKKLDAIAEKVGVSKT